jgi:chromosome partitioning protein
MRCIAIINQKGGCGKTTVAINLAACLAASGRRTLLVDMDPQSHCSVGLAVPEDQIEKNIYDVLISEFSNEKVELKQIIWQISQNFDLAPAGIELAAIEQQLTGREDRENCLRKVFDLYAGEYNYVIIDSPPSVGMIMFNVLRAAQEVIIPVETGYFALHGLSRQLQTLDVLRRQCGHEIELRVLPSMYDVRTKLAREVLTELRKNYKVEMLNSVINFNTKLKEAASFGQPIAEYDPASKGMRDFQVLAAEIMALDEMQSRISKQADRVETRLEDIGRTADDILQEAKRIVREKSVEAPDIALTLQEKIDQYYGVAAEQGKVKFAVLYPKAESVLLAGDFNGWRPEATPLKRVDHQGRWEVELPLEGGLYSYRYVVDGRWQQDPYNTRMNTNPFGEFNSVVEVK